jgi:hypothetical protein
VAHEDTGQFRIDLELHRTTIAFPFGHPLFLSAIKSESSGCHDIAGDDQAHASGRAPYLSRARCVDLDYRPPARKIRQQASQLRSFERSLRVLHEDFVLNFASAGRRHRIDDFAKQQRTRRAQHDYTLQHDRALATCEDLRRESQPLGGGFCVNG